MEPQVRLIIFDFNWTLYDDGKKRLYPDAIPLLDELSGKYRLAIVAKGGNERRELVDSLGISKYFDEVIILPEKCADDYRKVMEKLGVSPSETLVVGDRAWKDVRFGNECGAVTAWFRNGKFADELPREDVEKADYVVGRLIDILDILEKN